MLCEADIDASKLTLDTKAGERKALLRAVGCNNEAGAGGDFLAVKLHARSIGLFDSRDDDGG